MGPNLLDLPPRIVSSNLPKLVEATSSNFDDKVPESLARQSKFLHDVGELDLQLRTGLFLTAGI